MPDPRLPARYAITLSRSIGTLTNAGQEVPVPDPGFKSGGVG